jgi:hypothetical protein
MLISREQIGFQKLTKAAWLSLVYSTGRGDPGRIVNTGSPFLIFKDKSFIKLAKILLSAINDKFTFPSPCKLKSPSQA